MLVRVSPDVRRRLERDAKRARRSLSSEVERQLTDALRAAPPADPPTRALCYLIARIPMMARTVERIAPPEFNWRFNRFDYVAFKHAIDLILDRLAPPGPVEKNRYLNEDTPEGLGDGFAAFIFRALTFDPETFYSHGLAEDAPHGSAYYAIPQAARDLGLLPGRKQ
jgi:hypothetical protein